MIPFLTPGVGGGSVYDIGESLIFDGGNLYRTPASSGNRKTWTYSAWVKRSALGVRQDLFTACIDNDNYTIFMFDANDYLQVYWEVGTIQRAYLRTEAKYRDTSAHMHVLLAVDTTQATAADRVKLYVNGEQVSFQTAGAVYPPQNTLSQVGHSCVQRIGANPLNSANQFYGYKSESICIDGSTFVPSDFGETDATTGQWIPKEFAGSYGTNGFYLDFSDNALAANLGLDRSGNGNDFSVTGINTTDQTTDTPTNNFCTFNPLDVVASEVAATSDGNLHVVTGTTTNTPINCTIAAPEGTGKWLMGEFTNIVTPLETSLYLNYTVAGLSTRHGWDGGGYKVTPGNFDAETVSFGTVMALLYDSDTHTLELWKDGAFYKTMTVESGRDYTTGVNDSSSPLSTALDVNFGQKPLVHTYAGYKTLCTQNLPVPAIVNPANYFEILTGLGSGIAAQITGLGWSNYLTLAKNRDATESHIQRDTARGMSNQLALDNIAAESAFSAYTAAQNYVVWCLQEGVVPGFDIVLFTGNGTTQNVAHSLGVAPEFLIVKSRNEGLYNWNAWHSGLSSASHFVSLNTTAAEDNSADLWNSGARDASTFGVGSDPATNKSGITYVAYLFASIPGFSKCFSYVGNGSANGPFVNCGFRPKFILVKNIGNATNSWLLLDTERDTVNPVDNWLYAEIPNAESVDTGYALDVLSNGFKPKYNANPINQNGNTFVGIAFAELPFKYANAR